MRGATATLIRRRRSPSSSRVERPRQPARDRALRRLRTPRPVTVHGARPRDAAARALGRSRPAAPPAESPPAPRRVRRAPPSPTSRARGAASASSGPSAVRPAAPPTPHARARSSPRGRRRRTSMPIDALLASPRRRAMPSRARRFRGAARARAERGADRRADAAHARPRAERRWPRPLERRAPSRRASPWLSELLASASSSPRALEYPAVAPRRPEARARERTRPTPCMSARSSPRARAEAQLRVAEARCRTRRAPPPPSGHAGVCRPRRRAGAVARRRASTRPCAPSGTSPQPARSALVPSAHTARSGASQLGVRVRLGKQAAGAAAPWRRLRKPLARVVRARQRRPGVAPFCARLGAIRAVRRGDAPAFVVGVEAVSPARARGRATLAACAGRTSSTGGARSWRSRARSALDSVAATLGPRQGHSPRCPMTAGRLLRRAFRDGRRCARRTRSPGACARRGRRYGATRGPRRRPARRQAARWTGQTRRRRVDGCAASPPGRLAGAVANVYRVAAGERDEPAERVRRRRARRRRRGVVAPSRRRLESCALARPQPASARSALARARPRRRWRRREPAATAVASEAGARRARNAPGGAPIRARPPQAR